MSGGRGLRCLMVRPEPSPAANGGDEIVYRRTLEFLRERMEVEVHDLASVGKVRKLLGILAINPPEVTRFISEDNRRALAARLAGGGYDVALMCNEVSFPMIPVVARAKVPIVLTPHNLQSVVAASDPTLAARMLYPLARSFERRWYAWPGSELALISREDEAGLARVGIKRQRLWHAPPGPPPPASLAPDAPLLDEAVLTGSFSWWRKRRDLKAFAAGPALGRPIFANDPTALEMLGRETQPIEAGWDWSKGLRFGLIVDRFLGGFKLKSLEYVANNCIILTLADIGREFAGLPHAGEFVRHVPDKAAMAAAMDRITQQPAQALVERFLTFKTACLERFAWPHGLSAVANAIEAAAGRG